VVTVGLPTGRIEENDLKYWFPIEFVLILTQINIMIFFLKTSKLEIKTQIEKAKRRRPNCLYHLIQTISGTRYMDSCLNALKTETTTETSRLKLFESIR
jgi:hypothetical protein